jgi:NADH-quinone oxidoreductase subunit D
MHAAYYRPGGVYRDLPDSHAAVQAKQVAQRATRSSSLNENRRVRCSTSSRISPIASRRYVDEYETLLTDNRIWKQRWSASAWSRPSARSRRWA